MHCPYFVSFPPFFFSFSWIHCLEAFPGLGSEADMEGPHPASGSRDCLLPISPAGRTGPWSYSVCVPRGIRGKQTTVFDLWRDSCSNRLLLQLISASNAVHTHTLGSSNWVGETSCRTALWTQRCIHKVDWPASNWYASYWFLCYNEPCIHFNIIFLVCLRCKGTTWVKPHCCCCFGCFGFCLNTVESKPSIWRQKSRLLSLASH